MLGGLQYPRTCGAGARAIKRDQACVAMQPRNPPATSGRYLARTRLLAQPRYDPCALRKSQLLGSPRIPRSATASTTQLSPAVQLQESDQGQQQQQQQQPSLGDTFQWVRCWYPVMPLDYLDASRPTAVTLLGKPLVLWRDGERQWRCFHDACPHRLAPLSEGRVKADGTLMCSYHGWRFDSAGECKVIPQAEDAKSAAAACSSRRSCAQSYPVQVSGGLLWVWPDASGSAPEDSAAQPSPLPAAASTAVEGGAPIHWYMRDLPYGYEILLENLSDPAHLPFSHHNLTPGLKRSQGVAMPMKPLPKDHVLADSGDVDKARGVGTTLSELFVSSNSPDSVIHFLAPGGITYVYPTNDNSKVYTVIYAVPTLPGRSRVIVTTFSHPYKPASLFDVLKAIGSPVFKQVMFRYIFPKIPTWRRHLVSNKLFDQDGIFLALQQQRLSQRASSGAPPPWAKAYYMPTPSDRAVIGARRWIDAVGGGGPVYAAGAEPTPVSTRRQMLDRYEQHTRHCLACKSKLQQLDMTLQRVPWLAAGLLCLLSGLLGSKGVGTLLGGGWSSVLGAAAVAGIALCARVYHQAEDAVRQMHFTDFSHADNH